MQKKVYLSLAVAADIPVLLAVFTDIAEPLFWLSRATFWGLLATAVLAAAAYLVWRATEWQMVRSCAYGVTAISFSLLVYFVMLLVSIMLTVMVLLAWSALT